MEELTFLLQKHSAFCDNDWDVAIYETLAQVVCERDRDIRILDADLQRNSKNACGSL